MPSFQMVPVLTNCFKKNFDQQIICLCSKNHEIWKFIIKQWWICKLQHNWNLPANFQTIFVFVASLQTFNNIIKNNHFKPKTWSINNPKSTIVVLWLDLKNRVLLLKDKQEIRKFNFIVLLETRVLCHKHSIEK